MLGRVRRYMRQSSAATPELAGIKIRRQDLIDAWRGLARVGASRSGAATVCGRVTDLAAAHRVPSEPLPNFPVFNAEAKPPMERPDKLTWDDFSAPGSFGTSSVIAATRRHEPCMNCGSPVNMTFAACLKSYRSRREPRPSEPVHSSGTHLRHATPRHATPRHATPRRAGSETISIRRHRSSPRCHLPDLPHARSESGEPCCYGCHDGLPSS
jgi:hypothetical protein